MPGITMEPGCYSHANGVPPSPRQRGGTPFTPARARADTGARGTLRARRPGGRPRAMGGGHAIARPRAGNNTNYPTLPAPMAARFFADHASSSASCAASHGDIGTARSSRGSYSGTRGGTVGAAPSSSPR